MTLLFLFQIFLFKKNHIDRFSTNSWISIRFFCFSFFLNIQLIVTFLSGAIVTSTAQILRRTLRPLFVSPSSPLSKFKILYDMAGFFTTVIVLNYIAAPFVVLTIDKGLMIWKDLYFFGHILCGAVILMEWIGIMKWIRQKSFPILGVEKVNVNGKIKAN